MRNNIIKEIENGGSGLTIRHDQQFQKRGKKQKVIWNANTFFDYVKLLDNETEDTLSITPKKLFTTLYPEKPFNAEKLFSFFHDAHVPSKNNKAKKKLDQALKTLKNENKGKKVNLPKTLEQKEKIDFSTAENSRGDDFSGLDFSGSEFKKEKFEGRNLCATNFANCDLRKPTFDKGSTFDDKTNLQNAKVSEDLVSLLDSQNQQKILSGSDISDIDFSKY
ncbi:MAG: hypothetical protein NTU49_00300 [Gammaproteobacteria bacterium]|nr:hypothetical protein [Gammaproteobacteria bacterium]